MPLYIRRRHFIQAATVSFLLAACGDTSDDTAPTTLPAPDMPPTEAAQATTTEPAIEAAATLEPTPMCDDDDDETPAQTEGPYFTPNSPERTSLLEANMAGTKLVLTGYVFSTTCEPLANVLIDFWHASDAGEYDNVGYTLRGHQFSDAQGRYQLETIIPGRYPGRTRHIHVKIQAANSAVLTTQLYFPDEPQNQNDGIFNPGLIMDLQNSDTGKLGTFNFVL